MTTPFQSLFLLQPACPLWGHGKFMDIHTEVEISACTFTYWYTHNLQKVKTIF
jgi:hypothetical protein